ncbi:MAG TPA: hypothetical protein VEA40_06840 [Ramlibacter sp.]|nr:hypothetical protein [Ramlibacter sp.]
MHRVGLVLGLVAATLSSGCGWFERKVTANITGHAVTCVEGVAYLQFPSGVTVQYDRSGRIKTC